MKKIIAKHPGAQIAVCALSLAGADETPKRLLPSGSFSAPRGALSGSGPWTLDQASAAALIAVARNRSTDIVVDYEHQTLLSAQNGKPAPAAGWVDPATLEWRADGLYGVIKWTAAAKALIDGEEYRYLSPVFPYDDSGTPLDLLQIALTNTPALHELGQLALAAARSAYEALSSQNDGDDTQTESSEMDLKTLLEALGLPSETTEADALKALAALKTGTADLAALRAELGLKDGDDAKPAIAALKATPTGGVPQAVYDELKKQLAVLKASGEESERDRLIEEGMADGRIAGKATADWLRAQPIAVLKSHLKDAAPLAALSGLQSAGKQPDKKPDNDGGLSDADLAVCKQMGLDPKDYAKANA